MDIPEDIKKTVSTIRNEPFHWKGPEEVADLVARAILAERERWTNGSQVQIPQSREQAGLMISVAENYLGTQ